MCIRDRSCGTCHSIPDKVRVGRWPIWANICANIYSSKHAPSVIVSTLYASWFSCKGHSRGWGDGQTAHTIYEDMRWTTVLLGRSNLRVTIILFGMWQCIALAPITSTKYKRESRIRWLQTYKQILPIRPEYLTKLDQKRKPPYEYEYLYCNQFHPPCFFYGHLRQYCCAFY